MSNLRIANTRLISQQFTGTGFKTPQDIVAWMGAIQAQDFNMAKWAIGIRLPGCTDQSVEEALNEGRMIRTHVMRPTWHIVSPDDIYWMLDLTAPKIISSIRSRDRGLGLTEAIFSKSNALIGKALEGNNHLTRNEIADILERNNIYMDNYRISHIMLRAELDSLVCNGVKRGGDQTYALLEERVPHKVRLSKEEALEKMARKYFTSHCPATKSDFCWWSGLSASEARTGMESIRHDFITEIIDSQEYWIHRSVESVEWNDNSVYLLPAFDEYIISYKDRTAVLSSEHHEKAISGNGIFRPTIVQNGRVIGLWKKVIKKNAPIVELSYFELPDDSVVCPVEKAKADFNSFLGNK